MDGDIAPLPELCSLAEKYNCIMMVDDAHASGVAGPQRPRNPWTITSATGAFNIQVGTLSKAIGAMGGYVCGSRDLIDFLYLRARHFLFSTSHPPATAAACQAAFALLDSPEGEKLREKNCGQYENVQTRIEEARVSIQGERDSDYSYPRGRCGEAFEFSKKLFEAGVFAPAVGYRRWRTASAASRHRERGAQARTTAPSRGHSGSSGRSRSASSRLILRARDGHGHLVILAQYLSFFPSGGRPSSV